MLLPSEHVPVMVKEVVELAQPKPGEVCIDLTIGEGGHASELLPFLSPRGLYLGIDYDPLVLARTEARLSPWISAGVLVLSRGAFAPLAPHLEKIGGRKAHILLADLGISSFQLNDPGRGFSFHHPGAPLDLRMDPEEGIPASEWLAEQNKETLARILKEIAAVREARSLASALLRKLPRTMGELLEVVESFQKREPRKNLVNRLLLALRVMVNRELHLLSLLLREIPLVVAEGARVLFLSYHSAEDHLVKWAFRSWERGELPRPPSWLLLLEEATPPGRGKRHPTPFASPTRELSPELFPSVIPFPLGKARGAPSPIPTGEGGFAGEILTRKPLRPSREELARNPRSHSARLRAFRFTRV